MKVNALETVRSVLILAVSTITLAISCVDLSARISASRVQMVKIVVQRTGSVVRRDETPTHAFDRTPIAPPGSIGSIDEAREAANHIIVRGWIVQADRKLAHRIFAIVDEKFRYDITPG